MAEKIQSVTSSEWKLVQRRLDDLENLVTDLKSKLETLGECKCNRSNSNLETQDSDDEERETVIGLTPNSQSQSDLTSAALGILGISGQSTSTTNSEEILTSAERDADNTAASKSTPGTTSNLSDSTSANAFANGIPVSTKSTLRLANGIGIDNLERYRRAQVKLKRCDQFEVAGTSSSSEFRIANNKSTNKESPHSSKKRPVLQRKGGRGTLVSAPPTPQEKRFVCHFCSKGFHGKSHLTDHIRIHTGDKPFQCKVCSKTFTVNSALNTHTRVHTGVKPFVCGFCSKKFTQSSSLTAHVRRHTGERPYSCQFCPKQFATSTVLTTHIKVHTREKPYPCPFCPKLFSQSQNLQRHLKRHPGVTPQQQGQIHYE